MRESEQPREQILVESRIIVTEVFVPLSDGIELCQAELSRRKIAARIGAAA